MSNLLLPVADRKPIRPTGTIFDRYSLEEFRHNPQWGDNPFTKSDYNRTLLFLAYEEAEVRTAALLASRARKAAAIRRTKLAARGIIVTESGVGEFAIRDSTQVEHHETVIEHSGEDPQTYNVGAKASSLDDGVENRFSLDSFFARPLKVYDSTWAMGSDQNVSLDVWSLWADDPSVRAKFNNYSYFKGDLHLKISISGTPFHYGKVLISYQPYAYLNDYLTAYDSLTGYIATSLQKTRLNYLSQVDGCKVIDVKDNEPYELIVPFCSPKQAFRLFNTAAAVITNATSLTDFKVAGQLRLLTIGPPKVANDDQAAPLSINIYAWMTGVELSGPTGTNFDITAESKSKGKRPTKTASTKKGKSSYKEKAWKSVTHVPSKDEYTDPGPLTKVATSVAKIGNDLSDIPIIGSFARATGAVAGKLGQVFNLFGWSRPAQLEPAIFVKNNPYCNGALTSGRETTFKLSTDPKQELTVDSTFGGGSSEDELTIIGLASKETFITSFPWTDSDVALTDYLFLSCATPIQATNLASIAGSERIAQPSAMMFAAQPFSFWRGSITYRFEVVCSRFHRGKFLIGFEPNMSQGALIRSNPTLLNQQNTIIVDIQDTQDIEFTVEWNCDKMWLIMPGVTVSPATTPQVVATAPVVDLNVYANTNSLGFVYVQPLNELVQPTATSDVSINVYMHSKDLEVAAPGSLLMELGTIQTETESGIVNDVLFDGSKGEPNDCQPYMGEKIVSLRSLMKRYQNISTTKAISIITGIGTWRGQLPAFPFLNTTTGTTLHPEPEANPNIINYVRPAFMCMRGGVRYRIRLITDTNTGPNRQNYVTLSRVAPSTAPGSSFVSTAITTVAHVANYESTHIEGSATFHPSSNGGFEVEIPYYSNNLFQFAFNANEGIGYTGAVDGNYMSPLANNFTFSFEDFFAVDDEAYLNVSAASAEDFSFFRFIAAPPIAVVL